MRIQLCKKIFDASLIVVYFIMCIGISNVEGGSKKTCLSRIKATKGDGSQIKVILKQDTKCTYQIKETWSLKEPKSKDDDLSLTIPGSEVLLNNVENMNLTFQSSLNLSTNKNEEQIDMFFRLKEPQIIVSGARAYLLLPVGLLKEFMKQQSNASQKIQLLDDPKQRLVVSSEFRVDESLNVVGGAINAWDGKKAGAVHTISGKFIMFDYEFNSDESNPLIFKMTSKGYLYLGGAGTVKDLKTGNVYNF